MEPELAVVVQFDFCLSSERELLEEKLGAVYGDGPAALAPERFGLTPAAFFRRSLASVDCYHSGDAGALAEGLRAVRESEADRLEDATIGLQGPGPSADLSAFESVSTLVLRRESRNFLDVVTLGVVSPARAEAALAGDPAGTQAAVDALRRDLFAVSSLVPDVSAYERPAALGAPLNLFFLDVAPKVDAWGASAGDGPVDGQESADGGEAADGEEVADGGTAALDGLDRVLDGDGPAARLCRADDTPVTLLRTGELLTHRASGDHWGPLSAVRACEPHPDAPDGPARDDPDEPPAVATLRPVVGSLLPYLGVYHWARSRFGDVVDIEGDVEGDAHEFGRSFDPAAADRETLREITDAVADVNTHRDVCVDVADEFNEVRAMLADLDDDGGALDPGAPVVADGGTGRPAGHETYRSDLERRLGAFERHFVSITEKLERQEGIYHDQLTGLAARIQFDAARRNVELQGSIRRLTWVLLVLTGILTLEAVWSPLASAAGAALRALAGLGG